MCIKTHQNALFSREKFKTHLSQYQEHCMCIQIFTTDEMSFNFLGGGGGAAQSLSCPRVPVTLATRLSIKIRRENGVNCFGVPLKTLCEENRNYKSSHNIGTPSSK